MGHNLGHVLGAPMILGEALHADHLFIGVPVIYGGVLRMFLAQDPQSLHIFEVITVFLHLRRDRHIFTTLAAGEGVGLFEIAGLETGQADDISAG